MFLITITRLSQDLREPIRRKEQTWLSIPGTVVFIMCFHSVSEYKRQIRRVKMFLTASQGSTGGDTSTMKPIRSKDWVKNYVNQTWVYIYTVITLISTHILNRNKDFSHCTLQYFIRHISCNANVLYDLNPSQWNSLKPFSKPQGIHRRWANWIFQFTSGSCHTGLIALM